jgi:hypothetical protein
MAKGTTFNEAAEAIGDIIEKLPPSEKVPLLGMAAGFALSLVGAGDRQHARDRLGSRVSETTGILGCAPRRGEAARLRAGWMGRSVRQALFDQ